MYCLPGRIEGRVDLDVNGLVRWVITLQESAQAAEYLSILPSLSLPYAWLTAAQDPEDIRNGLELNGNGQFTATVTVSFASGEELVLQHSSTGISPQEPGLLLFTTQVSGSHPPDFDASSCFLSPSYCRWNPLSEVWKAGGTTGIPGANVTISISYQPADDAPARPVVELAVEHGSVEVSPNGTVIRFYSQSVLQGCNG